MNSSLTFRPATPQDAAFIAEYVLAAFHIIELDEPLTAEQTQTLQAVIPIVQQEGTLYSYKHAQLALVDAQPVGLLLSYAGADYRELRQHTFEQLSFFSQEELAAMDDECVPGDLYVDSLAVSPQHRGKGIAQQLLQRAVAQAQSQELLLTLLVDPDNPNARRLYEKVGFKAEGRVNAFGVNFFRMVRR